MKGTRPRGRWYEEDQALRAELVASEKERAENIMIVDMLRNDMGRISRTGSVHVPEQFTTEAYPTVWQMTSTITSKTDAGLPDIFKALFPCASVTGAPKVETMKIIHALEPHPRGVYCGAVGWYAPDRQAQFNVAIRTAVIDRPTGTTRYHVGSGITWDSAPAAEHAECYQKAAVLAHQPIEIELLETIRFDGERYYLLEEHLQRLRNSAEYFGISCDPDAIQMDLLQQAKTFDRSKRVRLLLDQQGVCKIEAAPLPASTILSIGFAADPVDAKHRFLYHKTTNRTVYEAARATRPECEDVILWNEGEEVTESTIANIAVRHNDQWFTPPVYCGLLPGTLRAALLREGRLQERVITKEELLGADEVRLINSVRGWVEVHWVEQETP